MLLTSDQVVSGYVDAEQSTQQQLVIRDPATKEKQIVLRSDIDSHLLAPSLMQKD